MYIPNPKYFDMIFYLIGKSTCVFFWWSAPTGVPLWTNHVLPYYILYDKKRWHIALLVTIQLRSQYHKENQVPLCPKHQRFFWAKVLKFIILGISSIWPVKIIRFFHLRIWMPSGDRTLNPLQKGWRMLGVLLNKRCTYVYIYKYIHPSTEFTIEIPIP